LLLKPSELVDKLHELDLTEREARVYLSVVKLGSCRVAEIAHDARLQRTEIYRIMLRLVSLDLVEDTIDRPRRYRTTKISHAIPQLAKRTVARLRANQEATEKLATRLSTLGQTHGKEAEQEVRVIRGAEAARAHLEGSIERAQTDFWGMAGATNPAHLPDRLWVSILRKIAKKKLQTQFLVNVQKENLSRIKRMASMFNVRHYDHIPIYFYGYDDQSVAMSLMEEPIRDPSEPAELVPNYKPSVVTMRHFFDTVWRESMPFSIREHLLLGTRPASSDTRIIRGQEEFTALVQNYSANAKELIGDYLSTRYGPNRLLASYRDYYAKACERGVKVQLICHISRENVEAVKELAALFDVRHKDTTLGFDITIVDRTDAIIHHVNPDSPKPTPGSSTYTVHITSKEGIGHLRELFRRLWEESVPVEKAYQQMEQETP